MFKRSLFIFFTPSLIAIALIFITFFFFLIPSIENSFYEQKKDQCKDLTYVAWNMVDYIDGKVKAGDISLEEAQQLAIEAIENLRYGDNGKNYFWITDIHNQMISHPYRKDLVGKNLSKFVDPDGNLVLADMTNIAREHGEGFYRYQWQWKFCCPRIQ